MAIENNVATKQKGMLKKCFLCKKKQAKKDFFSIFMSLLDVIQLKLFIIKPAEPVLRSTNISALGWSNAVFLPLFIYMIYFSYGSDTRGQSTVRATCIKSECFGILYWHIQCSQKCFYVMTTGIVCVFMIHH